MDAFFAAIEERDQESLRGLPIVVGADPHGGKGRGVVSTANYRARAYGIHSAMPISQAWRRSEIARHQGDPPVVFIRPNFERYTEVSERISAILRKHVSVVEEASIDEMYFDLSFAGNFEKAKEICQRIKAEIKASERLTASIGIGPNKLIAKVASDFKKPDGLTLVEEKDAEAFLAPLSVRKIPGIGPKTELILAERGIRIVQDLKGLSLSEFEEMFGKWGRDLYEKIRGHDASPIQEEYETKSIGEQETFANDTRDSGFIVERLTLMCQNVLRRLLAAGFKKFRTIVVTIRFADFETKSRSHTLAHPTDSLKTLEFEAIKLLMPFLDGRENPRSKLIRMIGVRVEKLEG